MVVATGVFVGENTLSAADVAGSIGAEPEVVARWLGGRTVHASALSPPELGARAAARCLEKAGVQATDVQAIVWGCSAEHDLAKEGRRELHAQHLIGATASTAIEVGLACSESMTAFRLARSLIRDDRAVERVLIVFGERRPLRTLGFDSTTYQPVFSDVGAAVLVARAATPGILAFSEGSDGSYWDFLLRVRENAKKAPAPRGPSPVLAVDPLRAKFALDSAKQYRRALDHCLQVAGITRNELAHVVLTREGSRIPHAIMRQLDLPIEKLFAPAAGPTHAGMADCIVDLDALLASGTLGPAQYVLLGARSVGTIRFCLLRT